MEYVVEDNIRRIITRVLSAEGCIDILNDGEREELAAFLARRSTGEKRNDRPENKFRKKVANLLTNYKNRL